MKYSEEEIQKAISRWAPYCSFWTEGICTFPNTWRSDNRSNRPKCRIIPGQNNEICNFSSLDKSFEGIKLME